MTERGVRTPGGGFTLVELMVVLAITGVAAAIALPNLTAFVRHAQFRRNEELAKSIYLDAEASLTYLRTSGQWESFRAELMEDASRKKGISANTRAKDARTVYVLRTGGGSGDRELLDRLIGADFHGGLRGANICVEIDAEAGRVYSAFYSTTAGGLTYTDDRAEGYLGFDRRSLEDRKPRRLGYYSVEDPAGAAGLPTLANPKLTSLELVNGERLYLTWSSDSHEKDGDAAFDIEFYDADDSLLWKTSLTLNDVEGEGIELDLQNGDDVPLGTFSFPFSYTGRFELVLDAMMDAATIEALAPEDGEARREAARTGSTSAARLPGMERPVDVYARVTVRSATDRESGFHTRESNRENTMFAAAPTEEGDYLIRTFRHLSNIRYMEPPDGEERQCFRLDGALDWELDGVALYHWNWNGKPARIFGEPVFPTIPALREGQILEGAGNTIYNLRLSADSVAGQGCLGLIGENEGVIRNLRLAGPRILGRGGGVLESETLTCVGAVCGFSGAAGALRDIAVDGARIRVVLKGTRGEEADLGVGCVAGVVGAAAPDRANREGCEAKGLRVGGGSLEAYVPDAAGAADEGGIRGIGGVIGCARTDFRVVDGVSRGFLRVENCSNEADVTGNANTGGVVGSLYSRPAASPEDAGPGQAMRLCTNRGEIRGEDVRADSDEAPRAIGAVAGFVYNAELEACENIPRPSGGGAVELAGEYAGA